MSNLESPTDPPPPPTDVERFQVVAKLIEERLQHLQSARRSPSFTPAESRELIVLEALQKDWIQEHRE